MQRLIVLSFVALAGCGGGPTPAPIVDMAGVDQTKYNRDLAACYDAAPAVSFGNPVSRCMSDKGYKVLVGF
jgi:hypothetical protein